MSFPAAWYDLAAQKGLLAEQSEPGPAIDCDEKTFQAAVVKLAKRNGWWMNHLFDARGTTPGIPDWEFARERYFRAELKSEKGKLRKEQIEVIDVLRRAGVCVYVWRPSDWSRIAEVMGKK